MLRPFSLFAPLALLHDGWQRDVRIHVTASGRVGAVTPGTTASPADRRLDGRVLLPAPSNLHSHAFQRAMAGLAQYRGAEEDSFWSWRRQMYRFLAALTPEMIGAITSQAQVEMCEAGFAAVAEFHYVHHAPSGQRYDNLAEMSERICEAADLSGIGLTLLPVLYAAAGADGRPPEGQQLRFSCDADEYETLWTKASGFIGRGRDDWRIGVAPHSLRAVPPDVLAHVVGNHPRGPIHMHVAEQTAEVEEIKVARGARPVEWLLEHAPVDERWCLIHATHVDQQECSAMAGCGAVVGLCPITEADLGDGVFPANAFRRHGGTFGVGTDSNVNITLAGELRLLEYGQRLTTQRRNVLGEPHASTGRVLLEAALAGGAAALDRACGAIEPKRLADLLALDTSATALHGLHEDQLLDGWIFSAGSSPVTDVWSAGKQIVSHGRHVSRDVIAANYRAAMYALVNAV